MAMLPFPNFGRKRAPIGCGRRSDHGGSFDKLFRARATHRLSQVVASSVSQHADSHQYDE